MTLTQLGLGLPALLLALDRGLVLLQIEGRDGELPEAQVAELDAEAAPFLDEAFAPVSFYPRIEESFNFVLLASAAQVIARAALVICQELTQALFMKPEAPLPLS